MNNKLMNDRKVKGEGKTKKNKKRGLREIRKENQKTKL